MCCQYWYMRMISKLPCIGCFPKSGMPGMMMRYSYKKINIIIGEEVADGILEIIHS